MKAMLRAIGSGTVILCALFCGGCYDFSVVRVGSNTGNASDENVVGQRYYLPHPFLLATPQKDGTVAFTTFCLPDKDKEYAVSASAKLSSYSLQVITDPLGILGGIQYNVDTTAVPAQVIASGATTAAQIANYKASQTVAVQAQFNAAQTQLLKDTAALDSDKAAQQGLQQTLKDETAAGTQGGVTQLMLDTQANKVASDQAAVAADQAAASAAQSTAQAVAGTAAFGTPLSSTSATVPGAAPAATGATLPGPVTLPDAYGPVIYAIVDTGCDVTLVPVNSSLNDTALADKSAFPTGASVNAQPRFNTSQIAMGAPKVLQPLLHFDRSLKAPALFTLDRPPTAVDLKVYSALDEATPLQVGARWTKDSSIFVDISKLAPGGYILDARITYKVDESVSTASHQRIYFVVAEGKESSGSKGK